MDDFDCQFRPAVETDYHALRKLLKAFWFESYSAYIRKSTASVRYAEQTAVDHLDAFSTGMEIAVIADRIVGLVSHTDGFVNGLYVRKGFRGSGIGTCLLTNSITGGAHTLDVVASNRRAVSFYQRNGWVCGQTFDQEMMGVAIPMLFMTKRR